MDAPKTWGELGIEVPLGKRGNVKVLCPKCSHRRRPEHQREKCRSVNGDGEVWYCHNCHWAGALAKSDWRREHRARPVYVKPERPAAARSRAADAWLDGRGIGRVVADRNGVTSDGDVLLIPFVRNGEVVTIKHRPMREKKFWMTTDSEKIPFGWDDCMGQPVVVVVEGEMDKFAIEQATGWAHVVSPPHGCDAGDEVLGALATICEAAEKVVLAGDMDAPGQKFMRDLGVRIGLDKCWTATWPEKDANDTLMAHGEAMVRECLFAARPVPISGILSMDDLSEAIDLLYERGLPSGASTGWPLFDRHYTVRQGQVTTITGSPMSGKSVFVNALLVNLARQSDWKFALFSPEMQPPERLEASLMACYVGKPFGAGPTQRLSVAEKDEAKAWLDRHFWFIEPEDTTLTSVLERAKVLVRRHGINGLVIDPWNDLDSSRENGQTETEHIHSELRKIRTFARNHQVHVWIVAHPRKLQKENGRYEVATPYDIAGSAGFYNKSDNCLSLWRDFKDQTVPAEMHIQKIKFHEIGGLGMVRFTHDRLTGRYREVVEF